MCDLFLNGTCNPTFFYTCKYSSYYFDSSEDNIVGQSAVGGVEVSGGLGVLDVEDLVVLNAAVGLVGLGTLLEDSTRHYLVGVRLLVWGGSQLCDQELASRVAIGSSEILLGIVLLGTRVWVGLRGRLPVFMLA